MYVWSTDVHDCVAICDNNSNRALCELKCVCVGRKKEKKIGEKEKLNEKNITLKWNGNYHHGMCEQDVE